MGSLAANTTAGKNTAVGAQALYTQSYSNSDTPWDSFNTAVGYQALYSNAPDSTSNGIENTAVGSRSMYSNTTGARNTVSGARSLFFNTTGSENTASGFESLLSNTTGNDNTADGYLSLYSNTSGSYNTASGYGSLSSNTSGDNNTAYGGDSLSYSTTGHENTAIGINSLLFNTIGSRNIGIGFAAGSEVTTGNDNIDIGNVGVAGEGNTTRIGTALQQTRAFIAGIRGVTPSIPDALPVVIDSAGQLGTSASAGAVSSVFGRTGVVTAQTGDYSASQITGLVAGGVAFGGASSGPIAQDAANLFWDATNHRLGIGTNAPTQQLELTGMMRMPMTAATIGTPTAGVLYLGANPFLHNYGPAADAGNTFVGQQAGNFTMGGSGSQGKGNTAIGYASLPFNTTGNYNTAVGNSSLYNCTTGYGNTASGVNSLFFNTAGYGNTASGVQSLFSNSTGSGNTASGASSLGHNTEGAENTASGAASLSYNTTGTDNTASGFSAGDTNTTGSSNTFLGALADASFNNLTNATAVGYGAIVNASNKVRIGNSGVTVIEGQVAWSWPSDVRLKENIRDLDLGLDFVLQLRPVAFQMKHGNGRTDMGFLAQDVEAVLGDGYNLLGIGQDAERTLSLRATDLIAPLVKAMQAQQAQIETQRAAIETQQAEIEELRQQVRMLIDEHRAARR